MIIVRENIKSFEISEKLGKDMQRSTINLHTPTGVFFKAVDDEETSKFLYYKIGVVTDTEPFEAETKSFEGSNQEDFFRAVKYFEELIKKRIPEEKQDPPSVGVFVYIKGEDCPVYIEGNKVVSIKKDDVAKVFTPPQKKPFGRLNMLDIEDAEYDVIKAKFALNYSDELSSEFEKLLKKKEVFAYKMTPYQDPSNEPQDGEEEESEPQDVNDEQLTPEDIEGEDRENMEGTNEETEQPENEESDETNGEPDEDGDSDKKGDEEGDSDKKGDEDSKGEDDGKDGEDKGEDSDKGDGQGDDEGEGDESDGDNGEDGQGDDKDDKKGKQDTDAKGDKEGDKSDEGKEKQVTKSGKSDEESDEEKESKKAKADDKDGDDREGGSEQAMYKEIAERVEPETLVEKLNEKFEMANVVKNFRKQERLMSSLKSFSKGELEESFYDTFDIPKSVTKEEFLEIVKDKTKPYFKR